MNMDLFKNPPEEYRPVPFWSWNDALEDEELVRQIGLMQEQGWGGFFMHSRVGLETPYMSEAWFDRMETCINEAGKRNMGAWLYDEDKWPSGYAGGVIPEMGPEYRSKALFMAEGSIPHPEEDIKILAVYSMVKNPRTDRGWFFVPAAGEPFHSLLRLKPEKQPDPAGDVTFLYFYQWTAPLGDPWFNGKSYVDFLNPEVTEAFLESTHERYASRFGEHFGRAVPGIFTDEPLCLYQGYRGSILPWTSRLPELFYARYGYDLLEYLPHLYYPLKGYEKVRFEYRKLITELFLEGYTKTVYAWCENKGLKFTGHFMCEDDLVRNLHWIGSLLPHYKFMHHPGIDHLARRANNIITQKQLQSVVNQFGKTRALTETYGCSGQNNTLEGLKWIADWQFVNGVNLINPHLSLYTMRGERKRDFPPNLFYQQPWWEYNRLLADYQTRLSYALSQGERVIDILVLHPIESAYIAYTPLDHADAQLLNTEFEKTLFMLMENHYDFDLGDEYLMETDGQVAGNRLQIGKAAYGTVVLPPLLNLRNSTLLLLKQFMENGGKIIVLKHLPDYIDGLPGGKTVEQCLKSAHIAAFHTLLYTVKSCIGPQVEITEADGSSACKVYYHKRKNGNRYLYFFANNDTDRSICCNIRLKEEGAVYILDPFLGGRHAYPAVLQKGATVLDYDMPPAGSLLLEVDTDCRPMPRVPDMNTAPARLHTSGCRMNIPLSGDWKLNLLDENALTLDFCSCLLEDGKFSEPMLHLEAQDRVKKSRKDFTLRYLFQVKGWDGSGAQLVMERPDAFTVRVNGHQVSYGSQGYWKDTSFKRIPIPGLLRNGENIIELSGAWNEKPEVEALYLLGNFKVEALENRKFFLVPAEGSTFRENLAAEGYPFYAGRVEISKNVMVDDLKAGYRYVLELGRVDASAVAVFVNGEPAGCMICREYRLDITSWIRQGSNTLTLRLANTLHNLLGPHHDVHGEVVPSVGPGSFKRGRNWTDLYYFAPFGIGEGAIRIQA